MKWPDGKRNGNALFGCNVHEVTPGRAVRSAEPFGWEGVARFIRHFLRADDAHTKCTSFIPNIKKNAILSCGILEYDVDNQRIAVGRGRTLRPVLFFAWDDR